MEDPQTLRQNLVDEAAKFLVNPKVASHGVEQKSAFLRKKGLSEEEIQAAFLKAKAAIPVEKVGNVIAAPGPHPGTLVPAYATPAPPSLLIKVRDVCNIILVLTGASYGLYYIYQRYVGPWLTGRRQKTVEESMVELQQSVVSVLKEVQTTLASLERSLNVQNMQIQALQNRGEANPKHLEQLKTEVSSLKGLLINKRTFPSTPSMAPSIPSWQRNKTADKPLEAAAESAVSLPDQAEVTEGESSSLPATNSQEVLNGETEGAVGETRQAFNIENGEVNGDGCEEHRPGEENDSSGELSVEPVRL